MHISAPIILAGFAATTNAFAFPQLNFFSTHNNAAKGGKAGAGTEAGAGAGAGATPSAEQGNNRAGRTGGAAGGFSGFGGSFGSASAGFPTGRGGQGGQGGQTHSTPTSVPTAAFGGGGGSGGRSGQSHVPGASGKPSGFPTSIHPPVGSSKPTPSSTPSDGCPAVWAEISSDLTGMFLSGGQCTDDARSTIRAIFHDCFPDGGCDGSLQFELSRPENSPMTGTVNKLVSLAQERGVGFADMLAFAACKYKHARS
jgi:hypothetical protein